MKSRYFPKLPICYAAFAGVSAFILYPELLALVAAPIEGSIDQSMPSERIFHRVQTVTAFTALGFVVPLAAIFNLPNQPTTGLLRRLGILTAISLLIATVTALRMRADLNVVAQFLSGFQTEEPDIPVVASYSIIPLYRIAIYPSVAMLVVVTVGFFRAFRSKSKSINKADRLEMATPKQPPD